MASKQLKQTQKKIGRKLMTEGTYQCPTCKATVTMMVPFVSICCGNSHTKAIPMIAV